MTGQRGASITVGAVELIEGRALEFKQQLYNRASEQAKVEGKEVIDEVLIQRIIDTTVVSNTSISE